jgi:hypothetical protein
MAGFDVFVKASGVAQPLCLAQVSAETAREGIEMASEVINSYSEDNPEVALDWAELRGPSNGSVFAAWRLGEKTSGA